MEGLGTNERLVAEDDEGTVGPLIESAKSLAQRSPRSKQQQRICRKLRPQRNARRLKSKLVGSKSLGAAILGQRSNRFFPGELLVRQCCHALLHDYFASRFHYQFRMRFPDREKVESVSKIVHSLGDRCWGWVDVQFALRQPVAQKRTRLETRHVVPD